MAMRKALTVPHVPPFRHPALDSSPRKRLRPAFHKSPLGPDSGDFPPTTFRVQNESPPSHVVSLQPTPPARFVC